MKQLINDIENIKNFILAGNATFTIKSKVSGTYFTFKVKKPTKKTPYFVSLLNGPDNESNYQILGTIFVNDNKVIYKHNDKKSRVGKDSPSNKAFKWFFNSILNQKDITDRCEFYHEGTCARCGRKLTTPESVSEGIGPVCKKKLSIH